MDRSSRDLQHYRAEASLVANPTDVERVEQMRELFEMYPVFQRTKDAEQLVREARAEAEANRVRLNPRYQALLDAWRPPEGSADDSSKSD